ncbi:wall associated protein [Lysobacter sp. TAF61]
MKNSMNWPLGLLLAFACTPAFSQEANRPWEEYDKLFKASEAVGALGPDLFGDAVDLASGALSFSATDVSVPGNSKLPVAITRSYVVSSRKGKSVGASGTTVDLPFADWDLDIPNLSGVFASNWPKKRCSASPSPPSVSSGGETFQAEDYWQGNEAHMPGGGEMLQVVAGTPKPATGGPYLWVTSGFTYFSCITGTQNGPADEEGFLAVTSDGTTYRFDRMAQFYETPLKSAKSSITIPRRKNALYVSRIEDRFGNSVTYTYSNAPNAPVKLDRIDASDGRSITIGYTTEGYISTVSNGTQTWSYQYSNPTASTFSLASVILPDNVAGHSSKWTINFSALSSAVIRYDQGQPGADDPVRSCGDPGDVITGGAVGTITHPSGAVGEFSIEPWRHGRSNVPMVCGNYTSPYNDSNDDVAVYPLQYDAFSLTKKRVTGPGLVAALWTYNYYDETMWAQNTGPICTSGSCMQPTCVSDDCARTATTEVAGPGGEWTRYTFGNSYRYNEGKLLKVQRGTGPGDIRRTDSSTYELAQSGQSFATPIGTSPQLRGSGFTSEYLRPQRSSVIDLDGVLYTSTVASGVGGFDAFARPLSVTKASNLGCTPCSRTDSTVYSDNLSKWVLGQVATVTNTNTGKVVSRTDYDATTALPLRTYSFGNPQPSQTLTYYGDGTVATVKDGNNNVTTLSSWKRGIPQTIQHPATPDSPSGATESAVVGDVGWIMSSTDENGYSQSYQYDAMGRPTIITYPAGEGWNPTTRTFDPVAVSEFGIPADHWRLTTQTGTGVTTTFYDGLWRPVLTWTRDSAVAGTDSFVVNRYDVRGQLIFTSYPVGSLTSVNDALTGTSTAYDILGRVSTVTQSAEAALGDLTSTTTYAMGGQVVTTNPRGFPTTTSFQAFDAPSTDAPISIASPGGVTTTIVRDVFGKPLSTTRTGPGG